MTAEKRIRMIVLEAQALEEAIEHYKPGWGCYGRKDYSKEAIKRGVKQAREHLMALVDELNAMEGIADGTD